MTYGTSCLREPQTSFQVGGLHIHPVKLVHAGDSIPGHLHKSDHVTIVIRGSVLIEMAPAVNGVNKVELQAAMAINVPKDSIHTIQALEDDTEFWCVFIGDESMV